MASMVLGDSTLELLTSSVNTLLVAGFSRVKCSIFDWGLTLVSGGSGKAIRMFRNKPQKELGSLPWYKCSFWLFCKLMPEVKTQNTKAKFASSIKEDFQFNESERWKGNCWMQLKNHKNLKINSSKKNLRHPFTNMSHVWSERLFKCHHLSQSLWTTNQKVVIFVHRIFKNHYVLCMFRCPNSIYHYLKSCTSSKVSCTSHLDYCQWECSQWCNFH
jgi:hypothetical protein